MQKISDERATYRKLLLHRNDHRRNFDLGSYQRCALGSRGVRVDDSDAVDTTATAFHRP